MSFGTILNTNNSQFNNEENKLINGLYNNKNKSIKTLNRLNTIDNDEYIKNSFKLIIDDLQKENDLMKYNLIKQEKYIQTLSILNQKKDIIILNIQNFINKISQYIFKQQINFQLNKINLNEFISFLKQLEINIISNYNIDTKEPKTTLKQSRSFYKIENKTKNLKNQLLRSNSKNKINENNIISKKNNNLKYNSLEECNDIRCKICRNQTKMDHTFYKEQKNLRVKGYLLTKSDGICSRTPPKDEKNNSEDDYNVYIKNINNEIYTPEIKHINDDNQNGYINYLI